MYCSKCGKEIDNQAAFCPACGAPVNGGAAAPIPGPIPGPAPVPAPAPAAAKKMRLGVLEIVSLLCALAHIGLAVYGVCKGLNVVWSIGTVLGGLTLVAYTLKKRMILFLILHILCLAFDILFLGIDGMILVAISAVAIICILASNEQAK